MEQLKEEKMMAEKSKFEEELEKLNINLTEHQKEQFDRYYEMLVEWNNVMNLTGITDYDEVNLKHFTDSLTLVRNIDMNKIDAVIDIGTGAGFPGLPIKIAFPHIHVVLLDSLNKRIKFLNAVITLLKSISYNLCDSSTKIQSYSNIFSKLQSLAEITSMLVIFSPINLCPLANIPE